MENNSPELVPEVIEFANGMKVPTGNMIAPVVTEEAKPEVVEEVVAEEKPAPVSAAPVADPWEGIDKEFITLIATDREKATQLLNEINTDYDSLTPQDLYERGWKAQHNFPGVNKKDLDAAFQQHLEEELTGIDFNDPNFGLTPLQAIQIRRTVEATRSQSKENQAKAIAELDSMKGLVAQQQPQGPTPEQKAQEEKFYQEQLKSLAVGYDGLPAEVAAILDPNAPKQFLAKITADMEGKPLFGLERFISEEGQFNLSEIAKAEFVLANHKDWLKNALEHGRSLGRAEMVKEYDGKLNPQPASTPGASAMQEKGVQLSTGKFVPLP